MMIRWRLPLLCSTTALLAALSCAQPQEEENVVNIGKCSLKVYLWTTEAKRRDIPDLTEAYFKRGARFGGAFVAYPRARYQHLYLKNANAHLSVAFLKEDGTIDEIQDLTGEDTDELPDKKGITSKHEIPYVLFVSLGWFKKNEVKEGEKVELPKALKEQEIEDLTELTIKDVKVHVELAVTDRQRNRGLMHRKVMSKDDGMLFVYPREGEHSFWMKNTALPLSLAYIKADGAISSIHDLKPYDEEGVPSKEKVRYVLEVNQGWFKEHGIKEGNKVNLPKSVKSLRSETE